MRVNSNFSSPVCPLIQYSCHRVFQHVFFFRRCSFGSCLDFGHFGLGYSFPPSSFAIASVIMPLCSDIICRAAMICLFCLACPRVFRYAGYFVCFRLCLFGRVFRFGGFLFPYGYFVCGRFLFFQLSLLFLGSRGIQRSVVLPFLGLSHF